MTIQNGNYVQLSADQIRDALESELQNEFGNDIDLTESSVFTTLAQTVATVLASNQEQSLEDVYNSAFLETATGQDLGRIVSLLGIQRRSAIHATGVERFEASGKVEQDHVIQRGTVVQTIDPEPVEFETTESVTIELIDSFEDGSLSEYSGDTSNASVVSSNAYHGSEALQLDATDGAHVYRDDASFDQGTTFHGHVRPLSGTEPTLTFAVQDDDDTDYYQIRFEEAGDAVYLERVDNGTVAATLDSVSVTMSGGNYYEAEVDWAITDQISVSVKDDSGSELSTMAGTDDTYVRGAPGFKSSDATDTKIFDFYTTSARSADIRAVEGGAQGNVGANAIQAVPSPPSGVNTVTNLYPTADTSYIDTSGNAFVVGEDEESDEELRTRAEAAAAGGGAATHDAIVGHLINSLDDVTSVRIYENKTDTDNTGSGGLPPHSFEAVVFGGTDADVAEAIFEKKAVTARDYGGAHGTSTSVTVTADTNGQQRTIDFSRPTEVTVDMTLDLVINDNYIGDDALKDRIVQYVGGTLSDGTDTIGLGAEDDVIIDEIRDIVVGPNDTGVKAFDQSVDGTPISTTPSITTVDGINVVDIGANEVATTDASDASITLNTRQQ